MSISKTLAMSLCIAVTTASQMASAQQVDNGRTLRIVVPFSAGTPLDVYARIIAPKLSDVLNRPVIVDDKPGAAGVIGTREVAKSRSSQDVLLFTVHSSAVVNPYLYSNLGYEQKDLEPVALIGLGSYLLVSSRESGIKSIGDLIATAKAKPGALRYGSYGVGSGPHLCMELLRQTVGISLIHVPYKGTPINDLVANNIELSIEPVATAIPFVDDGRINAIGYTTTLKTGQPKTPIPSISEKISNFECGNWVGMFAPVGAGGEFEERIHQEVEKILQMPDIRQQIQKFGLEPTLMTRSEFRGFVDKEYAHWGKIVRDAGVKMD